MYGILLYFQIFSISTLFSYILEYLILFTRYLCIFFLIFKIVCITSYMCIRCSPWRRSSSLRLSLVPPSICRLPSLPLHLLWQRDAAPTSMMLDPAAWRCTHLRSLAFLLPVGSIPTEGIFVLFFLLLLAWRCTRLRSLAFLLPASSAPPVAPSVISFFLFQHDAGPMYAHWLFFFQLSLYPR